MIQQAGHRQRTRTERIMLPFLIAGIDLVEVHLSQIAVEIRAQNFTARIQAIAAQTMLEFVGFDRTMVQG